MASGARCGNTCRVGRFCRGTHLRGDRTVVSDCSLGCRGVFRWFSGLGHDGGLPRRKSRSVETTDSNSVATKQRAGPRETRQCTITSLLWLFARTSPAIPRQRFSSNSRGVPEFPSDDSGGGLHSRTSCCVGALRFRPSDVVGISPRRKGLASEH